eukprot:TRINITY_DN18357_c0_g2_i1.p4 TRINITY_DN18357_c0_g2~~TRINITY_DN18357_c0_g2_i1.p4  ORF type:complete len:118 (+),score=2.86 TRINITY_DN18357_c0_g2_i1:815-1168(+)
MERCEKRKGAKRNVSFCIFVFSFLFLPLKKEKKLEKKRTTRGKRWWCSVSSKKGREKNTQEDVLWWLWVCGRVWRDRHSFAATQEPLFFGFDFFFLVFLVLFFCLFFVCFFSFFNSW